MNKYITILIIVLAACMIALGFNTLDWQTHICPPETWGFCWGLDVLRMPFWYAYFFGGILPLSLGFLLLGLVLGYNFIKKAKRSRPKFDLDPTVPRVVIIAILLFAEALLIPAYTILQQGRLPSNIEWLTFVFGAILQLVTFLMAFIKGEELTVEEAKG